MKKYYYTLIWILLFLGDINTIYVKLYIGGDDYRIWSKPSLFYDWFFWFFIIWIELLIFTSIIISSLWYKNKFSFIWEKIINLSNTIIKFNKNKLWTSKK